MNSLEIWLTKTDTCSLRDNVMNENCHIEILYFVKYNKIVTIRERYTSQLILIYMQLFHQMKGQNCNQLEPEGFENSLQ